MVDVASQFTSSLFTIYYKDHDYCCFKECFIFVIIKYFCRWIWNLWFTVWRNRYAHAYFTVRRITGWHRSLLPPHGYIGWRGFKYWTWILLIWSISLYLGTCSHIHLVGFAHDALRRSSITCSYFISYAWVFMKISGAVAKHTHITWHSPTQMCNKN